MSIPASTLKFAAYIALEHGTRGGFAGLGPRTHIQHGENGG